MHIKEIIIDGFKSYATRTVVSGFDTHFNAITGPNGSGKSNILDAIIFVLGINNLSQVRADDLQGLVYKKGQAGINKASVTLVFDNSDRSSSPAGYEAVPEITVTRQVVINGRNKYLINGHNAQQNRVHNLFHSVGLNVNKPHFLIMQGLITKVVNMKPKEVLAMIEEAAGTAMFEVKRTNALKTIEKKQSKVDEITKLITEEISPTLEKLRDEQKNYNDWLTSSQEIERLERFCIAFKHYRAVQILETSAQDIQEQQDAIDRLRASIEELSEAQKEMQNRIDELITRQGEEMEGEYKELEQEVNAMSKNHVKLQSEHKHAQEQYEAEQKHLEELTAAKEEASQTMEQQAAVLETMKGQTAALQEEADADTAKLKEIQDYLLTGVSSGSGAGQSYNDQLMAAKQQVSTTKGEIKQAKMQVSHLEKELKRYQKEFKAASGDSSDASSELEQCTEAIAKLEKKLENIHYDEAQESELLSTARDQERQVRQLRDEIDELSAKLANFQFQGATALFADRMSQYSPPSKGFDHSSVKGLVANLISIEDPDRYAGAIEVVAGGRLYNVVVDSEVTGKQLLSKGRLKRRVTCIPLNKIKSRPIDAGTVARAKSIVGEANADLALSLVGYDDELRAAMQYVFGNTFVCPDLDTANKLTFHKDIRKRSVTLAGDVCDPQGTMTGGSSARSRPVLRQLQQLNDARRALAELEEQLASTRQEIQGLKESKKSYSALSKEMSRAEHKRELLKQRMQQSEYHQLSSKIEKCTNEIASLKAQLKELTSREAEESRLLSELQENSKDAAAQKKQEEKQQKQKRLSDAKKAAADAVKRLKAHNQAVDSTELEQLQLKEEIESLAKQIESSQIALSELAALATKLEEKLAAFEDEYDSKKAQLDSQRDIMKATDKEISALTKKLEKARKNEEQHALEVQKSEHKIARLEGDLVESKESLGAMLKRNPWIEHEKANFGKKGSDFDFDAEDPKKSAKRLAALQTKHEKLSKSINRKVMNMFQQADQEYRELCKKREIIESDRAHIEQFIRDLDEKKNEALQITWKKVTRDFNSIFSTLLPGWSCKLEPPEGMEVKDGLEVKFARDGTWKDSLSELSGGQRSLLALSFILSMLLFKPAPMYILDEVDSALDLSNTQNIGQMLKAHFPQAQFVVVSLKEGMWNNANVLFKTKFVDGVSTVTRSAKKSRT